ncbi:pentapeptide repeat-containing protein [Chryseobacterium sp. SIMBA_029]|uniref:pentapeptide repeat-containing protein n=1 Tax=Chryseobacterium sp. SIMBA_029 TaxID=3085772 RepID=UPI00397BB84C
MMKEAYVSDQNFENTDCIQFPLDRGEYENCTFRNYSFEYADLSGFKFTDCDFIGCNLSMAKLINTAFRDVVFKECKMFGLQFSDCNEFGLSFKFESCLLNNSIFYKTVIKKTLFKDTKLTEVDFEQCDLSGSVFSSCDFTGAVFQNTNLEKADLRTSFHYSIDPNINRLKKAKFSLSEVHGLLYKLDIQIEGNS